MVSFSQVDQFSYTIEGAVHMGAVLDMNGDGNLDILTAGFVYPIAEVEVPVEVFLGDGQGGYSLGTSRVFGDNPPVVVHAREMVVADFNGDGLQDVFIADHGYDAEPFPGYQNTLLLSDNGGYIDASSSLPGADFSHSMAVADIDYDGDVDIFVNNVSSGYFLVNDGNGNFSQSTAGLPDYYATSTTTYLGDLNGDAYPDLVLGVDDGSAASVVYYGSRSGDFNGESLVLPLADGGAAGLTLDIDVGDLNGDGLTDMLFTCSGVDPISQGRYMQLLLNDGQGGFIDASGQIPDNVLDPSEIWQNWTHLVDLDGDGDLDIVAENEVNEIYLNDGQGNFSIAPVGTDIAQGRLVPVDSNGDGLIDLVSVSDVELTSYLNTTPVGSLTLLDNDEFSRLTGSGNDDVIWGRGGNDTLLGGGGNDQLNGNQGADRIDGEDGNDVTRGGYNDDTVRGGDGDDSVLGDIGSDRLFGDNGNDYMNGGRYAGYAGDDSDTLHGGEGDDFLQGNLDDDLLWGDGGNDTLRGGGDNDQIHAGGGDDLLYGDKGNDLLYGNDGTDTAVFKGNQSDYSITAEGSGWRVVDNDGAFGSNYLEDIEILQFDDGVMSL
ncbi:FG-GAP-like repeat-containing protein [Rhodovibrionaceae bacterium A322]